MRKYDENRLFAYLDEILQGVRLILDRDKEPPMKISATFLLQLALKLPGLISAAVELADDLKIPGKAKKAHVLIESLPAAIDLIEAGTGRDIFNDVNIADLTSAMIDAEAAALKARKALAAGLLTKAVPALPPIAA